MAEPIDTPTPPPAPKPAPSQAAGPAAQPANDPAAGGIDDQTIEALQAAAAEASQTAREAGAAAQGRSDKPQPFVTPDFEAPAGAVTRHGIDLLSDVSLTVRIELGRTRMFVEDVLQLDSGAVVELDKLAGDPVDVYVNNRHVARGEVLVLNDNFCVRINEILAGVEEERATG